MLGAQGQLGHTINQHAKPALLDTLDAVVAYGRDKVDFTKPEQIVLALKDVRPDVVINAAAYTAVDQAQTQPDLAHQVNAHAVGVLAEQCKKQGIPLVHYSSDYVFDGTQANPYTEASATNPVNVYGQSKLEGERFLAQVGGNWVVFRTSWVYAHRGNNFARSILEKAKRGEALQVVNDQTGAPTPANWLAELGLVIAGVVAMQRCKAQGKLAPTFLPDFPSELPSGEIFHASAAGQTTWHGYAEALLALAAKQGVIKQLPPLTAVGGAQMGLLAPRPAYSVLNNSKLVDVFRVNPPEWQHGLRSFVLNF